MEYTDDLLRNGICTQAAMDAQAVQVVFKKIDKNIRSTNEMNSYYGGKRPEWEKTVICLTIMKYIHVSNRSSGQVIITLLNPSNNEPSILLKFVKGGISYAANESAPFIVKGLGISATGIGTTAAIKSEWITYLNKLNYRPDKFGRSSMVIRDLKMFGRFNRVAGKSLSIAGKVLSRVGTVMLYYDVISRDSPSMITESSLIEATEKELIRLCNRALSYH